jgi:hypothetical protein
MFDHTLFSSEWYNIGQQITLLTQIHTTNLTLCSLLYYLSCVFQVLGISVQVSAPGIVLCLDIEKSSSRLSTSNSLQHFSCSVGLLRDGVYEVTFLSHDQPSSFFIRAWDRQWRS